MGLGEGSHQPVQAWSLIRRSGVWLCRHARTKRPGHRTFFRGGPIRLHSKGKEEGQCRGYPHHQREASESQGESGLSPSARKLTSPISLSCRMRNWEGCGAWDVPPLGEYARQLIAIRVDPQVLAEVKKEAKRRDVGYQTLINEILAKHAKRTA